MASNYVYYKNFLWRFAERWGAQLVTFVVSIILARKLDPGVYGIIALITVFTSILHIFIDSGFGNALIQKKEADDIDFSSVFYFNLAFSILLYVILFLAAPAISKLYNIEELTPLVRVMGLTLIVSGVKNVQQAYVSKNMLFKKFFYATLSGTVGAAIIGILLAYSGFGVWALVAQNLFNQVVDTVILWITVKWRPVLKFSAARLKTMFCFGWKLLISDLIFSGYTELRQLLIGKMYSSEDLAYYNQGYKFPNLISTNINTSINSILFPAMSGHQDNPAKVRSMLKTSIQLSQYIVAPCVLGLAACAEPLVRIILTEKWLPCVPYLQLFCLANVFGIMGNANQNAIIALGRSDTKLKIEITKTVFDLVVLVVTAPFGPMAIAIGVVAASVVRIAICAWPSKKLLDYSFLRQMLDILPSLVINFIMAACVWTIRYLGFTDLVTILIQVPMGIAIYIGLSVLSKSEAFYYILNLLKSNATWKRKKSQK